MTSYRTHIPLNLVFSFVGYLGATIFLGFIICCLIVLVLIYWKASDFLQNREGGRDADDDYIPGRKRVKNKENGQELTTITYSKLKSFASIKDTTFPIEEDDEQVDVIQYCTMEIALRYSHEKSYLSGYIEYVKGIVDSKSKKINSARFHIALLPGKKRIKTAYRPLRELNVSIAFGISNVTFDELSGSVLRLRLYGRRLEYGVPVSKERCLGESYMQLNECLESFTTAGEVRTIQAIMPKSQQFISHSDDLFAEGI